MNIFKYEKILQMVCIAHCKKTPKRKVLAKLREDRSDPEFINDIWAMDFIEDQLYNGQRLGILTIVDTFGKLCPSIGVEYRYRATDLWTRRSRTMVVPRRSGLIMALNLYPKSSICGLIVTAWSWTSRGPGSLRIMPSLRLSTVGSGKNV